MIGRSLSGLYFRLADPGLLLQHLQGFCQALQQSWHFLPSL
jgi:hypothetical protein